MAAVFLLIRTGALQVVTVHTSLHCKAYKYSKISDTSRELNARILSCIAILESVLLLLILILVAVNQPTFRML